MKARSVQLAALLAICLVPLACADLLGLEPGQLADSGSNAGDTAQGGGVAGAGATSSNGGVDAAGSVSSAGSGGLAATAGSGATVGTAGTDIGGADAAGGAPDVPAGGAPDNGPCKNGTCTECPVGTKQTASKDGYFDCIDAAEVTNTDYLAFTQHYTPKTVIASTACLANKSLVPATACSTALTDVPSRKLPVVCVDYCDAEAYCAMHGKRLCGRVGGTMNDPSDNADPTADEWYAACAGPGETIYPYGNTASSSKCNSSGYAPADMGPRDVETMSQCQGGIAGLYNMSGNVAEWEWSCSSTAANATCSTRGGSFQDGPYEVRCSGSISLGRMEAAANVGFRCCANLKN